MNDKIEFMLKSLENTYVYSPLYEHRNTTIGWLPCDDEEAYKSNLNDPQKKKLLIENNWIDRTIDYRFNSDGFRCEEFKSTGNDIMFIGCSFTMGLAIQEQHRWSTLLAKHLNMNEINIAIGGGSNDMCMRLAFHWIPKIKPKIVIMLSPPKIRYEFVDFDGTMNGLVHKKRLITHLETMFDPIREMYYYYDMFRTVEDNTELNRYKNVLSIKALCDYFNSKFFFYFPEKIYYTFNNTGDLGRDLKHLGERTNKKIFDIISNDIKGLL